MSVTETDGVTVFHGDCIEVMRGMERESVDAIVTDPPYGLGFLGHAWDALPPGEEWARECLRVLKPGGHMVAFGGTRTWHRLATAIEDAGFEIRDSIAWIHSEGMPKGPNGGRVAGPEWEGWNTTLRPALEPVVLCRAPFQGGVAENLGARGVGMLNVDSCRIQSTEADLARMEAASQRWVGRDKGQKLYGPAKTTPVVRGAGRWPANVILDHAVAQIVDAQGESTYNRATDGLGASRFFYCPKPKRRELPIIDGTRHPTVKPLTLMRWLVRLVTPPGGVILDPFAGSGTTVEAAILEGFDVIGIEIEVDYLPLIWHRVQRVREEIQRRTANQTPSLFETEVEA